MVTCSLILFTRLAQDTNFSFFEFTLIFLKFSRLILALLLKFFPFNLELVISEFYAILAWVVGFWVVIGLNDWRLAQLVLGSNVFCFFEAVHLFIFKIRGLS